MSRRSSRRSRPPIRSPAKTVAAIAACAALLVVPAAAAADWQVVPAPPGGISSLVVASADSWLVTPLSQPCCTPTLSVTADRGASWRSVSFEGFDSVAALGAAPDGSFRVVAMDFIGASHSIQVFRIAPAGGSEPFGPLITGAGGSFSTNDFAVDDEGATWVPYYSNEDAAFELMVVAADGSTATVALPAGVQNWAAMPTYFGMRLISSSGVVGQGPPRGTYELDQEGKVVPAEAYPVEFVDGQLWLSPFEHASWDGGGHWSESLQSPGVVPRAPGFGPPRYLISRGEIFERYSPSLFRETALSWPDPASPYTTVDAGGVLVSGGSDAIYLHDLPLPPLPTEIGQLPDDARSLIARADLFRADASLPPLTGDARISQASHNHSAYTAAHQDELAGLSAHYETPGKSGFTGFAPSDRCAAVGAACGGEVMYSPVPDPVGGWLATVFHRFLTGSPEAGIVGGGKADGGWYVMDSGADQNLLVQPFGYPVGRWRGESGFYGETPDPVDACRESGQRLDYPAGIAVTLFLPLNVGMVEKIEVRKHGDSQPLPGCLLAGSESFILDDPLVRDQTYDVSAEWTPGAEELPGGGSIPGPNLSYGWSFRFEPDGYGERPKAPICHALALRTAKSVARARRGGPGHPVLGIEEKVTLKQRATVRLRRARLNYWIAGDRHSVKLKLGRLRGKSIDVGTASYLRFRLPRPVVDRVEPGEPAELQFAFVGRRRRGCAKPVHVSRIRKIEIGWVRLRGPAAWVSGHGRRGR